MAPTQPALYRELSDDLHLSWSERELPERERTKHDAVVTSPPYPGLIDYHEHHRYAYELLDLDDRRDRELGAAARGTSRRAIEDYVDGIARGCASSRTCSSATLP